MLCDTNGGSLPHEVERRSSPTCAATSAAMPIIGIHCHDDTGCAVANSMAAVRAGARHVQGTLNGLGERTGNCQPHDGDPQPAAQARAYELPARGATRAADGGEPSRRRGAQPAAQPAGAVRRRRRRSPTRPASTSQRDRPRQGRLRARRSGARRQRHPVRRQRDGRPGDDHDEGRGARPRHGRRRQSTR